MLLGAVLFSNEHGYLGETEHVKELERLLKEQKNLLTKEEQKCRLYRDNGWKP